MNTKTPDHPFLVQGQTGPWEVVIGLEIHAQITSASKLFSEAPTDFGADPNANVSFVDAAFPGMLPVLNAHCVDQAIKTGLGLNAEINLFSVFDRKNYFYADLPLGYQISQFHHPIVGRGSLEIQLPDHAPRTIGITRIHLEQDAGKSIHDQHPQKSHIDLNRSGVGLMEIVTEPDLRSAEEAMAFMRYLRGLLRYLGTCDGNMEQGSLRADVNVSLRRPGEAFGTRAETKNVNSIRFIGQAIAYEIQRQMAILESGGTVDQETRLFDPSKGETRTMRSKEDAHDYRYFPDPDLPPLVISQDHVDRLREALPELPQEKKQRFIRDFGLSTYDADLLTMDRDVADFYENALKVMDTVNAQTGKMLANWMMGDFFAALNRDGLAIKDSPVTPQHLAKLVQLITNDVISGKIAKDVFGFMWESKHDPEEIVKEKGLAQMVDPDALKPIIQEILQANLDKVAEYQSGKEKLFGFFVGLAMKATQGKANPALLNQILKEMLKGQ